jgi:hypothetical protein
MDIVGDASAAIAHVNKFGLTGPTKYDDLGEKYLRLYGLLSAIYIQQQSILTIYRIMNVPNLKTTKESFEALQIRQLRHKISAHSTDYQTKDGTLQAYVPLRLNLRDNDVTIVRHTSSVQHESVNVSEAIESHIKLMIDTMDRITEKAIKTLFKGQDKKQKELQELSDLRIEKEGGLVFKGKGKRGARIIVIFAAPKRSRRRAG